MEFEEKHRSPWRAVSYSHGKLKNTVLLLNYHLYEATCIQGPVHLAKWIQFYWKSLHSLDSFMLSLCNNCALLYLTLWCNSWMKTVSDIKIIIITVIMLVFSCLGSEQNKIYRIVLSPNNFQIHCLISAAFDIEAEVTKSSFCNLNEI